MKIRKWFFVCAFIITPVLAFSQQVMEFTYSKITGDNKTVYFNIKGLGIDESERSEMLNALLADENIESGRIYTSSSNKTMCQLLISQNIGPEYIRQILNTSGYDYDFTTVSVNGELKEKDNPDTFSSMFMSPADDFPVLKSTGDKENDYEEYRISKEHWISQNQRKYNKQKSAGTAQYPIVISKADFNKYTAEKQQKLLAEPDKYIIK